MLNCVHYVNNNTYFCFMYINSYLIIDSLKIIKNMGTELSTMIHKYFKVKISARTIQDCRHRQLGMLEINILLKKRIGIFHEVCL